MKLSWIMLFLLAIGATAQDALKLLPALEPGTTLLQVQAENLPYNLRWGDLRFQASATFQTEWNDNIALTDTAREEDLILVPELRLKALWPITEANLLNLTLGIGYEAYIRHPADSFLVITPGSALSFDVKAGEFRLNFHDRFTYENDPSLYGNISGLARIGGLFNTAGFDVARDFQAVTVTLGYDHQDFISSLSEFNELNNSQDTGTVRVAYRIQPGAVAGIEAGGGATSYEKSALSSYNSYDVGAFVDWQVTARLKAVGKAGYVEYFYDTPMLTGRPSIPDYYLSVAAKGALSKMLSYNIEGGRENTVSVDGSLLQQWYVSVGGAYEVLRQGQLTVGIRYENAHQPFEDAAETAYFASSYERVLLQTAFTYPITRKLAASLAYKLIIKNSPTTIAQYTLNDIVLGLTFDL
jgi:hypothetical protein